MKERSHMRKQLWIRAGTAGRFKTALLGSIAAGTLFLSACDLGVTNPALIEESDLLVPGAVESIVNGARYSFGLATTIMGAGGVYSVSAILTDELTHVGSWVPPREISDGEGGNESPENQSHWGYSSRARWQAEDAIEKITPLVDNPASDPWVALATLYAGFSNRLLGDMFCEAVIDGGPLESHTVFFTRAEGHFTSAIQIAGAAGRGDLRDAAYAGRAQTRMMMGNWDGAVSDAGQVATGFVYAQPHSDNSGNEANGVYEWAALTSGQYSVWGTPFAEWGHDVTGTAPFATEGDPRASYTYRATVGPDNRRPFYFIAKYTSRNAPIAITKGTEMRLIEAEALLRNNNVTGALGKINEVRTHHGLDQVNVTGANAAWQLLMKERGLELWLEGRRLPDLRRWAADSNTRALINTTSVRGISASGAESDPRVPVYQATPFCLRISTNEIFSNPHLFDNPPT
jgi:starch-binding outer membrane protein, SusD/RagB family